MTVNERFAIYKNVRNRLVVISNKQCVNKPVFHLRAHFFFLIYIAVGGAVL
jgi:hypothetical protein